MSAVFQTQHPLHDDVRGRQRLDINLLLFGLNMFFVLVGYYATIKFNALGVVKILRILLMVVSFGALLISWRAARFRVNPNRHYFLVAFILAIVCLLPFSTDASTSLERFLTVAPFWLYVNAFAYYVRGRYGATDGLQRMVWLFLVVYTFPIFIFYISGNPFARLSIYGDDSSGFYSNQLGWASSIVIACLLTLLGRKSVAPSWWPMWGTALAITLWLLLITGSRSSYLALGVTLLVLLVFARGLALFPKMLISLAIAVAVFYALNTEESALAQRLTKTQTQLAHIEPRLRSAQLAFQALTLQNHRYVTGLGFDVYTESIRQITRIKPTNAHNSYLELFVTTGILVFGLFVLAFLLPTLLRYFWFDARAFAFLPPILIIPYFENNLGAGQFLFFPWMFILFWYMHDTRSAYK
jgi:O-antigen ligase